jgi:putative SOS response-associated peptidase YedK
MCNLYRMTKNADEVAKWFAVTNEAAGANFGAEVYPGYPGLVVAEGCVRQMAWGFPVVLKGKQGQPLKPKPVNNARDDKLTTAFWRDSFARRRCLIPVTQWAEAEGESGRMTRTWYRLAGHDLFAVAALWRPTAEWGNAYTMVMSDACSQMADVHDRMPVILPREQWELWQHGSPDEALALARTCDLELAVERTDERWAGRPKPQVQPSLL